MDNTILQNTIERILDTKTCLKKDSEGFYVGEICIDSDDMHIEDSKLLKELANKNLDGIYDFISDCLDNYLMDEYSYLYEIVEKYLDNETYELYSYEIQDFIREKVYFNAPQDFILGSEVLVNIIITAFDDWNTEFTENAFFRDEDNEDRIILGNGGLKWLIKQQGYNVKDFEDELNTANVPFSNKFFESIYNEIENTTTSLNALVVSTKMTLRELVELKEAFNNKTLKSFKIDKTCDIGLVDFWQGAGGLLDIALENDLVIPIENIDRICCDTEFCTI